MDDYHLCPPKLLENYLKGLNINTAQKALSGFTNNYIFLLI